MVGLVKQFLIKATGKVNLTKLGLEEVLLNVQIVLSNRSLIYIEDDIQLPVLRLNTLSNE